jgi:hypothetical protein
MRLKRSRMLRILFVATGTVCLVLGVIGILLPVLPTTPFILLSAACYARGSRRFYIWLMENRWFGPLVRAFRDERRIPKKAKWAATIAIVATMGLSIAYIIPLLAVKILMAAIGLAVIIYIWRFPS